MSTDLESYLKSGMENILRGAMNISRFNIKQAMFMAGFVGTCREASARRTRYESEGVHIPPFLIASITSRCNLHCAGCYARAINSCGDSEAMGQLTSDEWKRIFTEAHELGISFIILAGGEPMVRKDVIGAAAEVKDIMFPIITNGTLINDGYIKLFAKHRNLVPVISSEGGEAVTDKRRGKGVFAIIGKAMAELKKMSVITGVSVTVTKENLDEVFSDEYVSELKSKGCSVMLFIEYVDVSGKSKLSIGDAEREIMNESLTALRDKHNDMLLVAFPGDERKAGGCLAAGRGFFHINSQGGAEPCPFSPYSDVNIRDTSLKDALGSELFCKLKESELLNKEHNGGCVLFEEDSRVRELIQGKEENEVNYIDETEK